MTDDPTGLLPDEDRVVACIKDELAKATSSDRRRISEKFILAALGSIPWVGGFISAAADYRFDGPDKRADDLRTQWLEEHSKKIAALRRAIEEILQRFEAIGPQVDERIQSEEYLALVRRAFRAWDRADTEEKRKYVGNLVANSAGTRLCADDVVRLFIDWLDLYHEAHFAVIRQIYKTPGATRYDIWDVLYGELPREDSAEADLYRLLIRDLSTGGVIRQERETNYRGQFLRRRPPRRKGPAPTTMESAFEETKPYVLTGLGTWFVHYTMNEVVRRLEAPAAQPPPGQTDGGHDGQAV
jgi:hypothetical protein